MASFTSLTTSDGDITTNHFTQGNDVKVNWTYTGDINEITINKIDSNQNKTPLIKPFVGKSGAVITVKWAWMTRFGGSVFSLKNPMFIKVSDGTNSTTSSMSNKYYYGSWATNQCCYPNHDYPTPSRSFTYNVPSNMFSSGSLVVEFWKERLVEVKIEDAKITFSDGEVFNFQDRDAKLNTQKIIMRNKTFTFGSAPHVPIASDLNYIYEIPNNITNGLYTIELYDNLGQIQKIEKIITIGPQKFLYKYTFDSTPIKLSNGNVYNYPQDDKFDPYIFSTETSNEYNTISSIKHQETHKIKWKVSSKISKIKIDLHNNNGFVKNIANEVDAQIAYYDWYLNLNVNSCVFNITGNDYFIKITNIDDVSSYMSSDKFAITSTKVRINHPYTIKNGINWTFEFITDLQDLFSLSLYHYSFSTKKMELYTYSENNNSFNGFVFQNLTYSLNINQKYDWNIPLNFIYPDEGITYVKLESTNTLYSKYSRIQFIKLEINNTIFEKSNKILNDPESFGHTINKLKNNNYILVWYQKIGGQAPTTIKYKITDNVYNSIGTEKTIDLSNNDFVHNFLTSQLRNKIIPFNNGYVLLLPEHYKENNISKWKMYLYFYDANGNLDTSSYSHIANGKISAFTTANPIHDVNNEHNFQNWSNNHNFQLKNTDNGGFIIIKTVEKGDIVFREYDSTANAIDGDVILFSDPQKKKYTVELVNLKINSYMFFYRQFDTDFTNKTYYVKKFFYDGTTRNTLPTTGNFNLNLYNGNFKVNKIPVLKKTIALNENHVLVPYEIFDSTLEIPVVMGKILDVTNNNWNIISFNNSDTELDDEILSKTENLDSINGIFEYEFQKINNELILKYITNEENKKYQNIRFFRIMNDYKSIFQVLNDLTISFESLDPTLSEGGTSIESENKIILTDNIQNFSLYVSSQNPGLHNLEFNISNITDIRIINSSPVFPYLINTSTVTIDWSGNLLETDTVDIKLVKNNEITHTLVTDLSFTDLSYNLDINLINDLVLTETTPTIDTTYKFIIQSGTVYNETCEIYFTDIKNTYTLSGSDTILNTPIIDSQDNDYIYYKKDSNRFSTNLVSIPSGGFLMSYYKIKIRKKKSSDSSYDIEDYKTNGLYTDNSGTQIFVDKYNSNFQKVGNTYTSPPTESLYTDEGNVNLSNIPFNYNTDNTLIALKNGKFALIYVSKMNGKILCDILDHTTMESNIQKKELASITTTSPPFQPTSPFTDIISKNDFKIDSNYYPFFTKSGNYMVSSYKYTFNTKKFTYNNGFGICYTKFTINSKKIYLAFYDENANIIRGDVEIPINSLNHHQTDPTYNNLRTHELHWNDRWSLNDFINRIDLDITIMKNNDICIFVKDTGTAESWTDNHKDLVYFRYIIYNYSSNTFNHPPNTQNGTQNTSLLHITTTLLDKDSSPWNNYMYVNILDNGNIIFSRDNETPSSSGPSNEQTMFTYSKLFDKDLNLIKNVRIERHQFRHNNSGSTVGTDLFNTSLFHFNKKIIPIKGGFVMLLTSYVSEDNKFFIYDNNGVLMLDSFFGFNNGNLFEQMFILPKNHGFNLVYGGLNNNLVLKKYKNLNLTINFVEYPTTLFCGQTLNIQWIYGVNMGTTGKLDLIYKSTSDNFDLSQNIIQSINLGVNNSGNYIWVIPYDNFNNTPYKFKMTSIQFESIISDLNTPIITSIQKPNWTSITYPSEANHGSTFNIQWDYTGNMNFEQQDISSLKLEIIKIDGSNLYTLVEKLNHKTKNFNFNIPFNNSNFIGDFKIKISDLSGYSINTDISGSIFSFVPPEFKLFTMSSNIINQGNSVDINWDYSGNISNIKIDLYDSNSNLKLNIIDNSNLKTYNWNVPYTKDISGTGYTLKIHDISNNATLLETQSFEIIPTNLTLSNIQSSYNQNESYIINWDYSGNIQNVKIDLLDNNDNIKYNIIDNSNVTHKTYDWKPTLSSTIHGNFKIKISDKDETIKLTNPIVSSLFSIVKPSFNISKNNIFTHNEILFGTDYNINWNHLLTLPHIKIDLIGNNEFVENIVFNRSVTDKPFVWNIPVSRNNDFNNSQFHIRIRDENLIVDDISSNTFEIIKGDFKLFNIKDVNDNSISDISQNENYTINWDYSGNIKYINLDLFKNNILQENIVTNHNINTKSYSWIPNLSNTVTGNNFTIKMTDFSGNVNTIDTTPFAIIKPSFTISQANIINTNEVLFDLPYNVNWTHNLTIKSIQIDLFDIDGNKNDTIITELDINNKPFLWRPTFEYLYSEFKNLFNNIDTTKEHFLKISDLSGNADSISSLPFNFINSSIESLTIPLSINQNRSSTINWDYSGNISYIKIDLLDNNNNFQMNIIDNYDIKDLSYNWTPDLSKNMFGTNKFKLRIYDISENSGHFDSSIFSIVKPSLSITTNIEENKIIMSNNNVHDISWNFELDIQNINLFLMKNNNKVLNSSIVSSRAVNNKPYHWTLPLTTQNVSDISGMGYYIRIEDTDNIAEPVDSTIFEIIAPKFKSLTIPSTVNQNQNTKINWDYSGNISSVKIELIDADDSQVFDTIIDNSNVSLKTYNWKPNFNKFMFGSFKLKITDLSGFSSFICSSS